MVQIHQLEGKDLNGLFDEEVKAALHHLHDLFEERRQNLLKNRTHRQEAFNAGKTPQFTESHPALNTSWTVRAIPEDCQQRRVEITGPVNNPKMVINMLSETPDGDIADMAMLDFEDSMCPTWGNVIDGYENVIGAANKSLQFTQVKNGNKKVYKLRPERMAHMMVRVRGLHMNESNVTISGTSISAGLLDLFLCAHHTAKVQIENGETPMFYVPKIEDHTEARWWDDLFSAIENVLALPIGTLRVTALIETLPATFQIDEILYELRDHALGLNGGRWDKIFSDIKVLKSHPDRILADRSFIDMTKSWMENYQKHIIRVCHSHGAFALGGMSAFTPGSDEQVRAIQTEKVRADKAREAELGCDGCWVSHPYFVSIAKKQFQKKNQLDVLLPEFPEKPELLPQSEGPKTLAGLRTNIRVGIAYIRGWNDGLGCVAFDGLMEDLATLEISRAQVWQWRHHGVVLDDGQEVTRDLITKTFAQEWERIVADLDLSAGTEECIKYQKAAKDAEFLFLQDELYEFLTVCPEFRYDLTPTTDAQQGEIHAHN